MKLTTLRVSDDLRLTSGPDDPGELTARFATLELTPAEADRLRQLRTGEALEVRIV